MNERTQNAGGQDNRRCFIFDLHAVFGLLGGGSFLIFDFGLHLHPRQRDQLVNQRKASNWVVIILTLLLLAGFIFGVVEMIAWRLGHDSATPAGAGSFTELTTPTASRIL